MSFINVSEGSFLALHGLVLVYKNEPNLLSVKKISKRLNASPAHLSKVFQKLSKAGLVKSVRGPAGGFKLQKSPSEISFLDIYEIIEGKVTLSNCVFGKNDCTFQSCIFGLELNKISADVYKLFKKIKLSSFKNNANEGD